MILLDTNVLSELVKREPAPQVLAWFDAQPPKSLALMAVTVAELTFGLQSMPAGRRRNELEEAVSGLLAEEFSGAVLPFDHAAAEAYGVLAADLKRRGVVIGQSDMMIAAIALTKEATVVTRNDRHFRPCGATVVNPFA